MKILTAKYESGTLMPNSVIRITYEGQPSGNILNIPVDEENTDYQEYLEWVAEGNIPDPAD